MRITPILFCFLLATPCYAQTVDLGEIVAEGQVSKQSKQKPSAFSNIIPTKKYQERFEQLDEILRQEVGVQIKSNSGLGQKSTLSVRGSSSEQVPVFIDGIRVDSAQGFNDDLSSLPWMAADHIEIIRGGGSAIFGSDAVAGALQIVTPTLQDKNEQSLSLSGGSFGTFQLQAAMIRNQAKRGFIASFGHFNTTGDYAYQSTPVSIAGTTVSGGQKLTRVNNSSIHENFLLKYRQQVSKEWQVDLLDYIHFDDRDVPGTEAQAVQGLPQQAHETNAKNLLAFKIHNKNLWKDLSLTVTPYWQVARSHFVDPTPVLGAAIDVLYFNHRVGKSLVLALPLSTGKIHHKLHFGQELSLDYFDDDYPAGSAGSIGVRTRVNESIVLGDEISIKEDLLTFYPTLRFQYASDFDASVAAHLGVLYRPKNFLYFKANVENNFRSPNFTELYLPDLGYLRGNPNLAKEKSINYDAGLGVKFDKVSAELSYFVHDIQNSILFVPISAFTIAPVNTNDVLAHGLEAEVIAKPWQWMELRGSYTWLHSEFSGSNNQLPGRPKHKINMGIELKHPYGKVFVNGEYLDRLPIDFANTTFIDHRFLLDAGATFEFRKKKNCFLTLQGKNLTNVSTLDARGFPLPGISFFVTLGYKG